MSEDGSTSNGTTRVKSGTWLVGGLLALGVVAGTVAVLYWANYVTVVDEEKDPNEWDRELANKELAEIENELGHAKERGRFEGVLNKALAFVNKYPRFSEGYVTLAKVYIELYQWPEAYKQLEQCLAIDYRQPDVHHLAGTIQFEMGFVDAAERHYMTAHQLAPNEAKHLVYLAQVNIRRNEFDKASVRLLEALDLNKQSHEAYATMSDLHMKQNQPTQALQHIDKALQFSPVDRGVMVAYTIKRAAVMRRMGDAEGALLTLDVLFEDEKLLPAVAAEIAQTWGMLNRPERAAEFYEQAMEATTRTEWRLIAGAAEWRLKLGEYEKVRSHIRELRRLDPKLPIIADLEKRLEKAQSADAQPTGR